MVKKKYKIKRLWKIKYKEKKKKKSRTLITIKITNANLMGKWEVSKVPDEHVKKF